jgi:hypothetical protein
MPLVGKDIENIMAAKFWFQSYLRNKVGHEKVGSDVMNMIELTRTNGRLLF